MSDQHKDVLAEEERRSRAERRRRTAVLHRARLAPQERDLHPSKGEDAISLVTRLARASWTLSGQPWPSYDRAHIPVRFVRR